VLPIPITPAGQARWMNPTTPKAYKAGQIVKLQVIVSTNHGGKSAQQKYRISSCVDCSKWQQSRKEQSAELLLQLRHLY
jgi:hypothetical protein